MSLFFPFHRRLSLASVPRCACVLALLAALLPVSPLAQAKGQKLDVAAYAIADATSGYILEAHDGGEKNQIASLTKIATALVVFDWLDLSKRTQNELVTIPPSAASLLAYNNANPIGFQVGDQITIRDLLYACLVQSDNIAAFALANHVGRDLQRGFRSSDSPETIFVGQMNALARKLKMTRTQFLTAYGQDCRSTALDMVKLSCVAMKRSSFTFYASQKERLIEWTTAEGQPAKFKLLNTNPLLGVEAIDGVKTGTSSRAGACLILSAARPPESRQNPDGSHDITPRRLIVVLLGAPSYEARNEAGLYLMRYGWQKYDEWAAKGRPLKTGLFAR